jgi:hypothetical protein
MNLNFINYCTNKPSMLVIIVTFVMGFVHGQLDKYRVEVRTISVKTKDKRSKESYYQSLVE